MEFLEGKKNLTAAIVGGGGGIGLGFVKKLVSLDSFSSIHATWHSNRPELDDDRLSWSRVNVKEEDSIRKFSEQVSGQTKKLDLLIYSVGKLHDQELAPEKTVRQVSMQGLQEIFTVNTFGAALVAKHFYRLLKNKDPAVFAAVSAKVGSISDNRLGGWYSYRASKAALNMVMKNVALEFAHSSPQTTILSLHPGTTDTRLSQPFQKNVPEGKLFPVEKTVNYLWENICKATPAQSGSLLSWDGTEIPF